MITGRFQDTIVTPTGERRVLPWRPNLVVTGCYALLAALMKRAPGTSGVLWWAVGAGDESWDAAPPAPAIGDSRLLGDELRRHAVSPEDMRFVDASGRPSATSTSRIEVRGGVRADRSSGIPLREFGLFGGDASHVATSGTLINHVIHPRVDLATGELLDRRLILTFGSSGSDADELGAFGESLPVRAIKGVDDIYGRAFSTRGVASIGDLARFDPDERLPAIPATRLREFVEKALIVRRFRPLSSARALADLSVHRVLEMTPPELVSSAGGALDEAGALDARDSLGILRAALDAEVLRRVLVGALFG